MVRTGQTSPGNCATSACPRSRRKNALAKLRLEVRTCTRTRPPTDRFLGGIRVEFGGIWLAVFAREARSECARAACPRGRAHRARVPPSWEHILALSLLCCARWSSSKNIQTAPRARARARGHTELKYSFRRISRDCVGQKRTETDRPFVIPRACACASGARRSPAPLAGNRSVKSESR